MALLALQLPSSGSLFASLALLTPSHLGNQPFLNLEQNRYHPIHLNNYIYIPVYIPGSGIRRHGSCNSGSRCNDHPGYMTNFGHAMSRRLLLRLMPTTLNRCWVDGSLYQESLGYIAAGRNGSRMGDVARAGYRPLLLFIYACLGGSKRSHAASEYGVRSWWPVGSEVRNPFLFAAANPQSAGL
jgi:hypothetical protein